MRKPATLPVPLEGMAFHVGLAAELGLTRARTRSSDLVSPHRGIRSPVEGASLHQLCSAYAFGMSRRHFFSHSTAARLLGLPLPWRLQSGPLHVSALAPAREPRGRHVVGHLTRDARIVVVDELRVAHPVDVWCSLSTMVGLDDLVAVGDSLVRRESPLATMGALRDGVMRWRGKRGARRLTEAMTLVRARTDSPMETKLRLIIHRAGLPEPEVNYEITDSQGNFVAFGDLVYPEYRLLFEYDGEYHFADDAQIFHDIDRLDAVMAQRWRAVRLNKTHFASETAVAAKVRSALLAQGWRP